jgi:hypothetical protein
MHASKDSMWQLLCKLFWVGWPTKQALNNPYYSPRRNGLPTISLLFIENTQEIGNLHSRIPFFSFSFSWSKMLSCLLICLKCNRRCSYWPCLSYLTMLGTQGWAVGQMIILLRRDKKDSTRHHVPLSLLLHSCFGLCLFFSCSPFLSASYPHFSRGELIADLHRSKLVTTAAAAAL